MASTIDLTGQVAIVTGSGRGIGRAHALMLAERGAAVVVNDVGSEIDGAGGNLSVAEQVVEEIRSAGGKAAASVHDVGTAEGGAALVDLALQSFEKVDILIHNAGIVKVGTFSEMSLKDVRDVLDVHLMAGWYVGQPAWRDMASRGYGRIVLTSSGGIYGHPGIMPYSVAKAGLVAMAKCLHQEAIREGFDIKTNVIAPAAATRMGREANKIRFGALLDPAAVSAVAVYLASAACQMSGEVLQAGASHFARVFIGQTTGWAKRRPGITPEEVDEHLREAFDLAGFTIPGSADEMVDGIYAFVVGGDRGLEGELFPKASMERLHSQRS